MAPARTLRIHITPDGRLKPGSIRSALKAFLEQVLEPRGFRVSLRPNRARNRIAAALSGDLSLFLMEDPITRRTLHLREGYIRGRWRFEATGARDRWTVATMPFAPDADGHAAAAWAAAIRQRAGIAPAPAASAPGHVFVPLQGQLRRRRRFQAASPVAMVRDALRLDPARRIVVSLHPREHYDAADLAALPKDPRLSISTAPMHALLAGCDYVVTQNSSVAYWGFFHHKPAILYAASDFHHICRNVRAEPAGQAFARVLEDRPDYDRYLHWHDTRAHLDIFAGDAPERLIARLTALGWKV